MTISHIPEHKVPGKRLGRHVDLRVTEKRDSGGPPPLAPTIRSASHKPYGLPLDQGDRGSCTANALCGALNTVPHYQQQLSPRPPTLTEKHAAALYCAEILLEGAGPCTNDPGGTGVYVCEAAMQEKWCSDFQVATGVDEALRALVLRPVITGVAWYDSFDQPPASGIVSISKGAQIRGGHEFVVIAIDDSRSIVWCVNSWGPPWGIAAYGLPGGVFGMTFSTWATLLEQQGDCTVPRTAKGWVAA